MKKLALFFLAFMALTFLLSFIWFSGLSHYYYVYLQQMMNLYLHVAVDGIVDRKMDIRIIELDVSAELVKERDLEVMAYIRTFTERINKIQVKPPLVQKSELSQDLRSLTMNMIPMIALMIVTPGLGIITWKRKLVYIFLALFTLSLTHVFHMVLFYYSNFFPFKYRDWKLIQKLIEDLFIFWESLGRPISPLLTWLFFYNSILFKHVQVEE